MCLGPAEPSHLPPQLPPRNFFANDVKDSEPKTAEPACKSLPDLLLMRLQHMDMSTYGHCCQVVGLRLEHICLRRFGSRPSSSRRSSIRTLARELRGLSRSNSGFVFPAPQRQFWETHVQSIFWTRGFVCLFVCCLEIFFILGNNIANLKYLKQWSKVKWKQF